MRALSVRPEWAMQILTGEKTIEYRTWGTPHRGDLLICASARPRKGCIAGYALCVVNLSGVRRYAADDYEWYIYNVRLIRPFAVKGKLHLYDVSDDLITYPDEPKEQAFARYYRPLIKR